jgi:hypothetical protein
MVSENPDKNVAGLSAYGRIEVHHEDCQVIVEILHLSRNT